ncbi:KAP family P-loop NTPase fold protein [Serinibacter salmoneus]|uniref:KAP family P-loop NTPase fold protein n=1 Tax=Serinibacter salmoneus TaxID=556530 RepID=UPI001475E73C|nr:P-loop NTPase fold protein [Serinibacter salmoneus]
MPATTDELGMEEYVKGLTEFLLRCHTPMTVGVQGDWGSGKTSIMQMVREQINGESVAGSHGAANEDVLVLWFNTWQYSQFDPGEHLSLSIMEAIARALDAERRQTRAQGGDESALQKIRKWKFWQMAPRVVEGAIVAGTAAVAPEAVSGAVKGAVQAARETFESAEGVGAELDTASSLLSMREAFAADVKATERRVLIFIDDLDRLRPARAVEVMEAIKLFLDVEECVFVLAIDTEVVYAGVQEKYGSDFKQEKAQAFFDKIIQVPFQLPVAAFDVEKFFAGALPQVGISLGEGDVGKYIDVARNSVGTNPRSTKRLLNTYTLLRSVHHQVGAGASDLHLFALLALQAAYPGAYRAIAEEGAGESVSRWRAILSDEDSNIADSWGIPEGVEGRFIAFLGELYNIFGGDKFDGNLFAELMSSTSITGTSIGQGQAAGRRSIPDPGERIGALRAQGISDALIALGEEFEAALAPRKISLRAPRSYPTEWNIFAPNGEHERDVQLGTLRFNKSFLRFDLFPRRRALSSEIVEKARLRLEAEFSKRASTARVKVAPSADIAVAVTSIQARDELLIIVDVLSGVAEELESSV